MVQLALEVMDFGDICIEGFEFPFLKAYNTLDSKSMIPIAQGSLWSNYHGKRLDFDYSYEHLKFHVVLRRPTALSIANPLSQGA